MAELFLDLGNVGLVGEGVGGGGGAQRMDTEPVDCGADACDETVVPHDVAVDGGGIERPIQFLRRAVVSHGPEDRTGEIGAVTGQGSGE